MKSQQGAQGRGGGGGGRHVRGPTARRMGPLGEGSVGESRKGQESGPASVNVLPGGPLLAARGEAPPPAREWDRIRRRSQSAIFHRKPGSLPRLLARPLLLASSEP